MSISLNVNVDFTWHFKPLFRPKRFKIYFGGRGGMKTVSFSKALLLKGVKEVIKVLCVREYMSSMKASVHSSLKSEIETLKLHNYYDPFDTEIRGKNGTLIQYAGIRRDPQGIKSYDDFDICWIEEAASVSDESLNSIVIPTIRKKGSEVWISYNPKDEFGAVHSRFVKPVMDVIRSRGYYEDESSYVCRVNLEDNPFASPELIADSARMKRENPRKWEHVYGGECDLFYEDSLIQPEWFDAAIDAHLKLKFKPVGVRSVGFDPADTGDDKALIARHGSLVIASDRWSYGELPDAIDRAFEFTVNQRAAYLVYDEIGLGKGMKVYLVKSTPKKIEVVPFNSGWAVENPNDYYDASDVPHRRLNKDVFKNRRAQRYVNLADRFEAVYNAVTQGIYADPENMISISSKIKDIDVLKSELVKVKVIKTNRDIIQIQSKKDAVKEGIKSPNMADALKMSFANPSLTLRKSYPVLNYASEF